MQGTLKWITKPAVLSAIGFALAAPSYAEASSQERLWVRFVQPTFFQGAVLQGDYLIVHDADKMANEEPCLFVYRARTGTTEEPVASMHGKIVDRPETPRARIATGRVTRWSVSFLREIQFPGMVTAHQPE